MTDNVNCHAAGAAMIAAPHVASAETVDSGLLLLLQIAKTRAVELAAAEKALDAALERYVEPSLPDCLRIREGDEALAGIPDDNVADHLGKPLDRETLELIRMNRHVLQRLASRPSNDPAVIVDRRERLERLIEIDLAYGRHKGAVETAQVAAGLPAAYDGLDRAEARLKRAWRAVAFTPAKSRDEVLAKLEAVACFSAKPLDPNEFQETSDDEVVMRMAVADFAVILETRAA